jgi:hypothetical protein
MVSNLFSECINYSSTHLNFSFVFYNFSFSFSFLFLWYWGLNSGSHLSHAIFALVIFQLGSSISASYFCDPLTYGLRGRWYHWHVPPHQACCLRCSLANFVCGSALNCNPPDVHSWSS